MTKVVFDVSISVDGFLGGPNASLEESLGAGGGALHEWAFATKRFREQHGLDGGEEGVESDLVDERLRATGATLMGRLIRLR